MLPPPYSNESNSVPTDTKRIDKQLIPTHSSGISVVLRQEKSAFDEATFISAQIKHLVAHTGNMIQYGDIAILLRVSRDSL